MYEGRFIDDEKDKWILFIHAGAATKRITITPETPTQKLMHLRDFVAAVDECKSESDQLSTNFITALGTGTVGSYETLKGVLTDNSLSTILGAGGIVASTEEIHQFVIHFNNAKNAQTYAEKLFEML